MAYIKAYSDENRRHPDLFDRAIDDAQVPEVLAKLCKEFRVPPITLQFTKRSGGGHYKYHDNEINLTPGRATWLLIAHEFAHAATFHTRKDIAKEFQVIIDGAMKKRDAHEPGHPVHDAAVEQIKILVARRDKVKRLKAHSADFDEKVDAVCDFIRSEKMAEGARKVDLQRHVDLKADTTVVSEARDLPWYKRIDLVQSEFERLTPTLHCPKCEEYKPKEEIGMRVLSRSVDGFPTKVRRQSYCRPCRSKK